jgi:hypothetical protein
MTKGVKRRLPDSKETKGNKREMKVRKGMDPQQHDDARRSMDPLLFRTDKTLTEAPDALFFVVSVYATFTLPWLTWFKGNKREMKVRKGMDPQQHDDARRSMDPLSFRTNQILTEASDALLCVTIVYATFTLP